MRDAHFPKDFADSWFYGCIRPSYRIPFAPTTRHEDYAYLTKQLWRGDRALFFLKPEFFAVPGLGRAPAAERALVLFGGNFVELEERFPQFLDEFEYVLSHLHWGRVHAHLRGRRSGSFEFSWTATRDDLDATIATRQWDFAGPRAIEILHDGMRASEG